MIKRIAVLLCCFFAAMFLLPVSAEPIWGEEFRCNLDLEFEGDFTFAFVGQELTLNAVLSGREGKVEFLYCKESPDKDDKVGFKWKTIEGTEGTTAKFIPDSEGVYFFAAEATDKDKITVSSLDNGWTTVLVIDPEKKTVVSNDTQFDEALAARDRYIYVDGNLVLDDYGVIGIDQQTVLEIAEGATLTLKGTKLVLAEGNWDVMGTLIIDGALVLGEGGLLESSVKGTTIFLCGDGDTEYLSLLQNVDIVPCNMSPFKTFSTDGLMDRSTGYIAKAEGLTNYNIFEVDILPALDPKYVALNNISNGEVIGAFCAAISGFEGDFTVVIPGIEGYDGAKLPVYTMDISKEGAVEPKETKVLCRDGEVNIVLNKNTLVMIKTPSVLFSEEAKMVIYVGAGAFVLMICATVIPAIFRKAKSKKKAEK